ncbi:hypothetical protein ACVOMS_34870 [Bradyrhizobium guangxiense]
MLLNLRDDVGAKLPKWRFLQSSAPAVLMLTSIGALFGVTQSVYAAPSQQAEAKSSGAKPSGPKAASDKAAADAPPAAPAAPLQRFDIDDFAVQGADKLPQIDVEEGDLSIPWSQPHGRRCRKSPRGAQRKHITTRGFRPSACRSRSRMRSPDA